MEAPVATNNKIELLDNDIVYIEKVGDQTVESMTELYNQLSLLAGQLRAQGKPVLVLVNVHDEREMNASVRKFVAEMSRRVDMDKSASYAPSPYLRGLRDLLIRAARVDDKVANFETREEALAWLLGKPPSSKP
jgi:hypothetical protein